MQLNVMCNLSYVTTKVCNCMCRMQLNFSCKRQLQNPNFLVVSSVEQVGKKWFLSPLDRCQSWNHVFPNHLKELLTFSTWIWATIIVAIHEGQDIEKDTLHMSMLLTLEARSYRTMWAYGNHISVSSVEEHLSTTNYGVATIFEQECRLGANDCN